MVISEKQHQANLRNAQHSTGPVTPEGKAAVRLNALKYGLRARVVLMPGDDPEEYKQLWADFEAEWQPQGRGERMQLEQMAVAQWLLARVAFGENEIYQEDIPAEKQFGLLGSASRERAHLQRSYIAGRRELEHMQQKRQTRQARQTQPQPAPTVEPAPAPVPKPFEPKVPPPDYVMSEAAEAQPAFSAPAAPDTR